LGTCQISVKQVAESKTHKLQAELIAPECEYLVHSELRAGLPVTTAFNALTTAGRF